MFVCITLLEKKYKNPVFSVICVIIIDNQTVAFFKVCNLITKPIEKLQKHLLK